MSDLIERESLKSELIKKWNISDDHDFANKDVWEVVEGLPPAEPKKGKWVDIVEMDSGGYPFKVGVCCSACGAPTLSDDNYCPHCGAKMEVIPNE